jgi:hypothetical protein
MGTLHVKVDNCLEEASEALVTIQPLNKNGTVSSLPSVYKNEAIPVGNGAPLPKDLTLPVGHYLVQVTMPSGEILSKAVDMESDSATNEMELKSSPTPHEWLSWHQFSAGDIVEKVSRSSPARMMAPPGMMTIRHMTSAPPPPPAAEGSILTLDPLNRAGMREWENISGLCYSPIHQLDQAIAIQNMHRAPITLNMSDNAFLSFVVDAFGPEKRILLLKDPLLPYANLCLIPSPWQRVDQGGFARFDVAVSVKPMQISSSIDVTERTSVVSGTIRDGRFSGILAFLSRGDNSAAQALTSSLLKKSQDILFDKCDNPLAASGAGYVLLSTVGEDNQKWFAWLRNLMNLFPWLPDGAVLWGYLKLLHSKSESDMNEGMDAVMEAFERGIPYYTKGIRLLLDSIDLLTGGNMSEENRVKLLKMQKLIRRISIRCDATQPFTTLRAGALS